MIDYVGINSNTIELELLDVKLNGISGVSIIWVIPIYLTSNIAIEKLMKTKRESPIISLLKLKFNTFGQRSSVVHIVQ